MSIPPVTITSEEQLKDFLIDAYRTAAQNPDTKLSAEVRCSNDNRGKSFSYFVYSAHCTSSPTEKDGLSNNDNKDFLYTLFNDGDDIKVAEQRVDAISKALNLTFYNSTTNRLTIYDTPAGNMITIQKCVENAAKMDF